MAAKMTANGSSRGARAPSTICAASSRPGRPAAEKTGSFCPRTSVFIPSMAEIPVSMKSDGRARRTGFNGAPAIGRSASPTGGGSPSTGAPRPSNARPRSSRPTTVVGTSPVRMTSARRGASPIVSSSSWMTTTRSDASSTCPRRSGIPSLAMRTHSPRRGRTADSRNSSGPTADVAP